MPDVSLNIVGKNLSRQAMRQLKADLKATAQALEETEGALVDVKDKSKGAKEGLIGISIGATAAAAAVTLLVKSWVSASIQFEKMFRGLSAVAGGAAAARKQLVGLRKVAMLPGLGLGEAVQGSIALQAVGFEAGEAEAALMAFGNALATVGKGRAELSGVILALTQMRAKGKVMGDDLRQIANYLPQIRRAMLDAFGTASSEQIQKMGVTAEKFVEVIVREFDKLPKVAGGAANSIENLRDTMFQLKVNLGNVLLPTFTQVLDMIAKLVEWIDNLSESKKKMIVWGAVTVAALAAITAAVTGFILVQTQLVAAISAVGSALLFMTANPIGLAITALAALTIGIIALIKHQRSARMGAEKFSKALADLNASAEKHNNMRTLANRIAELRKELKLTVEETQELIDVQSDLAEIAPELIDRYDAQGNALTKARGAVEKYIVELEKLDKIIASDKYEKALKERTRLEEDRDRAAPHVKRYQRELEALGKAGKGQGRLAEITRKSQTATAAHVKRVTLEIIAQDKVIAEYERKYLQYGAKLKPQNVAAPKVEPLAFDESQLKQQTALEIREAKLSARAIEDKYDRQRALARANMMDGQADLKTRQALLDKAAADDLKTVEEVALAQGLLGRERVLLANELRQKLGDIDKDEANDKKKLAEDTQKDLEIIQRKRLAIAKEIANGIKETEEEIASSQVSNARVVIGMIDDRYTREIASANLLFAINDKRLIAEEKAQRILLARGRLTTEEREVAEKKLTQIKLNQTNNHITLENTKSKITKKIAEEDAKKEEDMAQRIFDSKIKLARAATQIFLGEQAQRRASIILEAKEEENRLNKIISDTEESAEIRKQAAIELSAVKFMLIAELDKVNEEFEKKRENAREKRERDEERAAKKIIQEQKRTLADWEDNERLRASVMSEGLDKQLEFIKLAYQEEVRQIKLVMALSSTSEAHEEILANKLQLLRTKLAKDYQDTILANYQIIDTISNQVAAIPSEMIRMYMRLQDIQDDFRDQLRDLHREERQQITEIRWDAERSAAERAQAIERIEKESAQKRLDIEKDLQNKRKELFMSYVTDFLGGILSDVEESIQEKIAGKIKKALSGEALDLLGIELPGESEAPSFSGELSIASAALNSGSQLLITGSQLLTVAANALLAGIGSGGGGSLAGIGQALKGLDLGVPVGPQMDAGGPGIEGLGGLASAIFGVATGNPFAALQALPFFMSLDNIENDMVAKVAGGKAALYSASFDSPTNDFRAQMAGNNMAAKALGQRSAGDLVSKFSEGFTQAQGTQGSRGDGEITKLLATIAASLGQPPKYELHIDGRQLDSTLQPIRDEREFRSSPH